MIEKTISGVYFILNKNNGLIKIGCSKNIINRFYQLQNQFRHLGLQDELELINYIECKNYTKLESYIHSIFKINKSSNEWFKISNKDIDIILQDDDFKLKLKEIEIDIVDFTKNKNVYLKRTKKLNATEKGVWYSLGELSVYPSNNVVINGEIPTYEDIAKYIGMSERNLRRYLNLLEDKNLIKIKSVGFRKSIFMNPEYYATGKDLDLSTLKLFNLVECDDNKINNYL